MFKIHLAWTNVTCHTQQNLEFTVVSTATTGIPADFRVPRSAADPLPSDHLLGIGTIRERLAFFNASKTFSDSTKWRGGAVMSRLPPSQWDYFVFAEKMQGVLWMVPMPKLASNLPCSLSSRAATQHGTQNPAAITAVSVPRWVTSSFHRDWPGIQHT